MDDSRIVIPFLTYEEQLEKLKNEKNMYIQPEFNDRFISLLSTYSYYEIVNRYKNLFNVNESDIFPSYTELAVFFFTHYLQTEFHSMILKYIMHIERSFRTKLSYTIAKSYGTKEYDLLNKSNYIGRRVGGDGTTRPTKKQILDKIKKEIDYMKKRDGTSCNYFDKKNTHIPPWISLSEIKFSSTINLFGILKEKQRNEILNDFSSNLSATQFINTLSTLREYRNRIAHYRKINRDDIQSFVPDELFSKYSINTENLYSKNDMMSVIIAIYEHLITTEFRTGFIEDIIFTFNRLNKGNIDLKIELYNNKSFLNLLELPNNTLKTIHRIRNL